MARVDDAHDDDLSYETTYSDVALPHGWKRVAHNSGLFCFLYEPTGVVSWSQPYVVQAIDRHGRTTLDDMVQAHRPPIEIFAAGCGMRQPDLNRPVKLVQAESILRRLNEAVQTLPKQKECPTSTPSEDRSPPDEPKTRPTATTARTPAPTSSRKRPLPDDQTSDIADKVTVPPAHAASLVTSPDVVVVGDITMENPAGKLASTVLTKYLAAAGRPAAEFVKTMSDDPAMPFRCGIVVNGEEMCHATDVTNKVARERAAGKALDLLLPGYWAGLKEEGLVRDVTSTPPSRSNTDWTKPTLAATTMEDFELMAIHDPGVLQGCMDLSFKTPAQLLMEFQSKNKGIAVNYTTVTLAGEGKGDRSAFKVTASVGPTAAEGIAGNKKVAKQLAAQALLAQLNPRVATYCDLIRLHENNVKLHADGVNRAKLQKLATKYGGGTMSTSSTSGGSPGLATAQPALLPSPTSSLAVAPGIVPEPSASTSNHGRRYGKGQVPNSYRVGWDPGHPRRGQRIDNNLYHGYGGHAAPVESYGSYGGPYDNAMRSHQSHPPSGPFGGAYNPIDRFPASAYDYNPTNPRPPGTVGLPPSHSKGWDHQQPPYHPRSPSRHGGMLPSPHSYAQPPSSGMPPIRTDLRHSHR
ncbi:hypothetical protein H310_11007 [Aphanomyces invadans]|uniref:DRBM domain-containing protein n=1 Tax=Aphanomyces invadans TaxID=157072 RepID=A0A024TPK5_9STRA|nr:hypothetical protein H310_11007 [Aphanomyces invadans]ETV95566.1 hypothetical protein H310_11007 [Aphanomyces invadans]|eukprot:XP_008875759.1 hypothetical protein H310_11007 [Aphanomyces invadans]